MGKKTIHHPDLETLLAFNREVVALTKEPHGYSEADGRKLVELVSELETRANNQDFDEAVVDKGAFLVFKLASGQYFRAGNKRTALVAGLCFLSKNGYALDLRRPELVETVDRAGMAAAGLDDLYSVLKGGATKAKVERKGWEQAIKAAVEANRDFLTRLAS